MGLKFFRLSPFTRRNIKLSEIMYISNKITIQFHLLRIKWRLISRLMQLLAYGGRGCLKINPTAPKTERIKNTTCTFNKHGFCKLHKLLGTPHTFQKSVWKDRGGGRGFGFVKERVNTFKCASKINPAVNTIASWLNNKNPSTSTSTVRPDAAVWAGVGEKKCDEFTW